MPGTCAGSDRRRQQRRKQRRQPIPPPERRRSPPDMSIEHLTLKDRRAWRRWLREHHDSSPGVWLVFRKQAAGGGPFSHEAAVEEALCYGWIDSLVRSLDADRFARKITPRRPDSKWSTINRRRYARLAARGLLAAPGRARSPTKRSGDAPRPSVSPSRLPADVAAALRASPRAARCFEALVPSHRRLYIAWIEEARREATRKRRLREAIGRLARGEKPGLK